MSESVARSPITYEEYAKTYRARVFAGATLLFAGVAFVFFSGCFQVGVLAMMQPAIEQGMIPFEDWGTAELTLLMILHVMSGVCFLCGLGLTGAGFVALSRTIGERP